MLTIDIFSFSYKHGDIPQDEWGNGGGFVFDCRCLPNPFNNLQLRDYCGKDQPVIDFFKPLVEVSIYLENCHRLIVQAANNYQARNFEHLLVSFGCTGGQHRSVYCAEQLAKKLNDYGCLVNLRHCREFSK